MDYSVLTVTFPRKSCIELLETKLFIILLQIFKNKENLLIITYINITVKFEAKTSQIFIIKDFRYSIFIKD